jgi:hypothetical protein
VRASDRRYRGAASVQVDVHSSRERLERDLVAGTFDGYDQAGLVICQAV